MPELKPLHEGILNSGLICFMEATVCWQKDFAIALRSRNGLFEIESAKTPTDVTALNLNPIIIGKANDSSNAAANHCLDTQS